MKEYKDMDYSECSELAAQLEDYSELEGTELGEACEHLISLVRYSYCFDDAFNTALITEINRQLVEFKKNSTIVEVEVVPEPYKRKELEWG